MPDRKRPGNGPQGDLVKYVAGELGLSKHQTRTYKKRAVRFLKIVGLMMASAIVVPISMISLGLLLGPKGYEGLVAAPLAVFTCWGLILFFGLRKKATKQSLSRARLGDLPEQIESLLVEHRRLFPAEARATAERILEQLEELGPALHAITQETPATRRLRKLLAEDLSDLVDHYRRLPARLRKQALRGGESPERQLLAGLSTIENELSRMHDEMADDDLYSLAAKQRYLELKYGSDKTR